MYKKICVTNRKLVNGELEDKIEEIFQSFDVDILILREKDLPEKQFTDLADKILKICKNYGVNLYINTYYEIAKKLNIKNIALPLQVAQKVDDFSFFDNIIISIHSKDEIIEAENLGATALMYGNIFETSCKIGKAGVGVDSLNEIVNLSKLPIYAIGGIVDEEQEKLILSKGAKGIAKMSTYMKI
ncbi:MAG: thiamine phosphate synthase [Clostridia bacterium]|nr:thiamine phosphate synthase [Clostridia bacterium]